MSGSLPQTGSDCPPLIKLIRLGILGGLAATPVSITFRDFPADLLSHLWRAVVRFLPPEQVMEVWSHSDLHRLRSHAHRFRVVLMAGNHRTFSSNALDWVVELRRAGPQPLPAVFSVYHHSSPDTPGATLVAQGDPRFCNDLGEWLQQKDASVQLPNGQIDNAISVKTDRLLLAVRKAAKRPLSLRDFHIVTGLIVGAAIDDDNSVGQNASGQRVHEPGPAQYAQVRNLLNSRPLGTIEQPYDDLTLHMVARANAYLPLRSGNSASKPGPLGARGGRDSTLERDKSEQRSHQRPITRRELADLGNPNSSVTKELLNWIAQNGDAEALTRIGVEAADRSTSAARARPPQADELKKRMTTWTYKMVRTRFDRLQSEGLIEARRTSGNAALEYLLPEELLTGNSVFSHLPESKEVRDHYEKS